MVIAVAKFQSATRYLIIQQRGNYKMFYSYISGLTFGCVVVRLNKKVCWEWYYQKETKSDVYQFSNLLYSGGATQSAQTPNCRDQGSNQAVGLKLQRWCKYVFSLFLSGRMYFKGGVIVRVFISFYGFRSKCNGILWSEGSNSLPKFLHLEKVGSIDSIGVALRKTCA